MGFVINYGVHRISLPPPHYFLARFCPFDSGNAVVIAFVAFSPSSGPGNRWAEMPVDGSVIPMVFGCLTFQTSNFGQLWSNDL